MVGVCLIVEHNVVTRRDAENVVDAGASKQQRQIFNVVLVGHHVVGVAAVAAHGNAGQLAHEVVFQTCADNLLAVVKVLGSDEADDRVDHERVELPGKAVTARFHGNLICAIVRIGGELAALACLKIHDVRALGGAALFQYL